MTLTSYVFVVLGSSALPVALVGGALTMGGFQVAALSEMPARRVSAYASAASLSLLATLLLIALIHFGITVPAFHPTGSSTATLSAPGLSRTVALLGFIWSVGAFAHLAVVARQLWALHRIRRRASDAFETAAIGRSERRVRVARGDVDSPCVIGIFRTVIIFPEQVEEIDPALLAHELAHVARNDFAENLWLRVVRAALWWHPGVRALIARAAAEREYACDEIAAHVTGSRVRVARALVGMAHLRSTARLAPAAATHPLLTRIKRLGEPPQPHRSFGYGMLCLAALALASAGATVRLAARRIAREDSIARAYAVSLLAPAMPRVIHASDRAGNFTVEMRRGRVTRVAIGNDVATGDRLLASDNTVRVRDPRGAVILTLAVDPRGQIAWEPRTPTSSN